MTAHDERDVETVAEALRTRTSARCPECRDGDYWMDCTNCDALTALDALGLPARERRAKAEALRDAAAWMQDGVGEVYDPSRTDYVQQAREAGARRAWLRARAAEIDPEEADDA